MTVLVMAYFKPLFQHLSGFRTVCSTVPPGEKKKKKKKTNSFSARQKVQHILWNIKVHFCVNKSLPDAI
jgi:hypothetical protein